MGGVGDFVEDAFDTAGDFVEDVFDTGKDFVYSIPVVGDVAKGVGNILEETYEYTTGLDAKREAEKRAKEIEQEYIKRIQEAEAERRAMLAKRRRELLASAILQSTTEADRITNTAVNTPNYNNVIPSLGGVIDMSNQSTGG